MFPSETSNTKKRFQKIVNFGFYLQNEQKHNSR